MTQNNKENILIAQITDTHIVPEGNHWRNDINAKTDARLNAVIEHINKLETQPDLVIHTGDIVDNGSISSYQNAKKILSKLNTNYFLACGNHDNFDNLKHVFNDHKYFSDNKFSNYVIDYLPIRIIVLDTTVKDKDYGKLCKHRISWLSDILKSDTKDTIIFLHHFPIEVNNELFNDINLLGNNPLSDLILQHQNILGTYCGHYHYEEQGIFGKKPCLISPSTAPCHMLNKDQKVVLNYSQPAYSLHYFNQDKKITSKVIRLIDYR